MLHSWDTATVLHKIPIHVHWRKHFCIKCYQNYPGIACPQDRWHLERGWSCCDSEDPGHQPTAREGCNRTWINFSNISHHQAVVQEANWKTSNNCNDELTFLWGKNTHISGECYRIFNICMALLLPPPPHPQNFTICEVFL